MPGLNEVPAYRRFIDARDKALEKLLNRAVSESNDLLAGTLTNAVHAILAQFETLKRDPNPAHSLRRLEAVLDGMFETLARSVAEIQSRMMAHSELLAAVGEVEGIARATGKPRKAPFKAKRPTVNERGEPILGRARLSVLKIQRKLMDAVQAAVWLEEDMDELKRRLARALPEARVVRRPPRVLKPIKEAKAPDDLDPGSFDLMDDELPLGFAPFAPEGMGAVKLTQGFLSDAEWDELVDHVKSTYIPAFRGPDAIVGRMEKAGEGEEIRYAWEFEQECAHELVRQVSEGTNAAARENGITSFAWIAIVDDRTDECCLWRDGLTIEEIKEALQNSHSDDECEALAPPAHFNCRCRLAPVIDKEDLKPPPSNLPEFDEWLTNV